MHFTQASLLALLPIIVASWDIRMQNGPRLDGSRSYGCQNLENQRGDKLKWRASDGTQNGPRCCLYVYKREGCDSDSRGFCRDYNDELDFHFRSFEVDCDGRRTGGYQGSGPAPYYPSSSPYYNGPTTTYYNPPPQPYQTYNNPPPNQPYNSWGPYGPPYPNDNRPYNCRPGDRCYVDKEAADTKEQTETSKPE
jgi:hypothetical protein